MAKQEIEHKPVTPPAVGVDPDALKDAIASAVAAALPAALSAAVGEAVKPLGEQISKLAPAQPPKTEGEQPKALTAEDVAKLLDERDTKRSAAAALEARKREFLATHTKDSKAPARYFELGDDPGKWESEIAAGQKAWEAEFKAAGGTIPDVAAPPKTGEPPKTELDASKLTQEQFANQFLPKVPEQPAPPAPEQEKAAVA